MPVLGKVVMATVAGGVALGAMLGAAANPVMKKPPEKPFTNAFTAPVTADADRLVIEAPPEDLSPYRDSYAPTWAREELADWEPDYPAWTYSDYVDRPSAESMAEDVRIAQQPVAATAEVTAGSEAEPVAPTELAAQQQPAAPAPYARHASTLDEIY